MEKKLVKDEGFEKNIESVDAIIEELELGELTLDESIKAYEKAMKFLQKSSDILNKAQGKILKINKDFQCEEVEDA